MGDAHKVPCNILPTLKISLQVKRDNLNALWVSVSRHSCTSTATNPFREGNDIISR